MIKSRAKKTESYGAVLISSYHQSLCKLMFKEQLFHCSIWKKKRYLSFGPVMHFFCIATGGLTPCNV